MKKNKRCNKCSDKLKCVTGQGYYCLGGEISFIIKGSGRKTLKDELKKLEEAIKGKMNGILLEKFEKLTELNIKVWKGQNGKRLSSRRRRVEAVKA